MTLQSHPDCQDCCPTLSHVEQRGFASTHCRRIHAGMGADNSILVKSTNKFAHCGTNQHRHSENRCHAHCTSTQLKQFINSMCCQVNGTTSSTSDTSIPKGWEFLSMTSQMSLATVQPDCCLSPGWKLNGPANQQSSRLISSLQAIKVPSAFAIVASTLEGQMRTIFLCNPATGSHSLT